MWFFDVLNSMSEHLTFIVRSIFSQIPAYMQRILKSDGLFVVFLFFCLAHFHHLAHGNNELGLTETTSDVNTTILSTVKINTERACLAELSIELCSQLKCIKSNRIVSFSPVWSFLQNLFWFVLLYKLFYAAIFLFNQSSWFQKTYSVFVVEFKTLFSTIFLWKYVLVFHKS